MNIYSQHEQQNCNKMKESIHKSTIFELMIQIIIHYLNVDQGIKHLYIESLKHSENIEREKTKYNILHGENV